MRYEVIKEGVAQRRDVNDETSPIVPIAIGGVIEISESMATFLLEREMIRPVQEKANAKGFSGMVKNPTTFKVSGRGEEVTVTPKQDDEVIE